MSRSLRLFVALVILLSGLALLPYIGLPSERFSWRQFAGAYEDGRPYKIYLPIVLHETTPEFGPAAPTTHLPGVAR